MTTSSQATRNTEAKVMTGLATMVLIFLGGLGIVLALAVTVWVWNVSSLYDDGFAGELPRMDLVAAYWMLMVILSGTLIATGVLWAWAHRRVRICMLVLVLCGLGLTQLLPRGRSGSAMDPYLRGLGDGLKAKVNIAQVRAIMGKQTINGVRDPSASQQFFDAFKNFAPLTGNNMFVSYQMPYTAEGQCAVEAGNIWDGQWVVIIGPVDMKISGQELVNKDRVMREVEPGVYVGYRNHL